MVRLAKTQGVAVVLVGHVTKDGQVAGPRVVEHLVDAVMTFEGERGYPFRILRAGKNRFGATDEIGVFEMGDAGLMEVVNPSELFLSERLISLSSSELCGATVLRVLFHVSTAAMPATFRIQRRRSRRLSLFSSGTISA